jgi:hypothetical protein
MTRWALDPMGIPGMNRPEGDGDYPPSTSWCLDCGGRSTCTPNGYYVCDRGHTFNARRCPTCGFLGLQRGDVHVCEGPRPHRFWVATRRCVCGGLPTCPEEGDVWVCEGCERWEAT